MTAVSGQRGAARCALIALPLFAAALLALGSACGADDASSPQAGPPGSDSTELLLASTSSTQDSGLLDALMPAFEDATPYSVKLISGGSGQAIEGGRRGDVDVLLVHSPAAEKQMIADGDGIERKFVMHNDFILVGPEDDPAGAATAADISAALRAIAGADARFVSRGDDSGTHVAELRLWEDAGIDPASEEWYQETGQGQGATLQVANQRGAYALTDRGTFLAQKENLELIIISEGNPDLLNYYHVIVVNPEKHPDVNVEAARAWSSFVSGPEGQEIIRTFGVEEYGEPLFFPDAGNPDPTE